MVFDEAPQPGRPYAHNPSAAFASSSKETASNYRQNYTKTISRCCHTYNVRRITYALRNLGYELQGSNCSCEMARSRADQLRTGECVTAPYWRYKTAVSLTLHICREERTVHATGTGRRSSVQEPCSPLCRARFTDAMSKRRRREPASAALSPTIIIAIYCIGLCYQPPVCDAGGLPNVIRIGTSMFSRESRSLV